MKINKEREKNGESKVKERIEVLAIKQVNQ